MPAAIACSRPCPRLGSSVPAIIMAKPMALDSVGRKSVRLLPTQRQSRWRFSFLLRRTLLFPLDKSRRPPRPDNLVRYRFGLRPPAVKLRKPLRAGRVIGRLVILE